MLPAVDFQGAAERDQLASLRAYTREVCFIHGRKEPVWSRDGRRLGWLFDLRPLLLDPSRLRDVCALFWSFLGRLDTPFQLAGAEMSAIPLLVSLQQYGLSLGLTVNALVIRKDRKRSGRLRRIEGIPTACPVIVVDDVLNSGRSVLEAVALLRLHQLEVGGVLSILDFGHPRVQKHFAREQLCKRSIFSLGDLVPDLPAPPDPAKPELWRELWHTRWSEHDSWHITPKSTPAVNANALYFGTDSGDFFALNQLDGRVLWQVRVDPGTPKGIWSSPALADGNVYFGAYDGNFYCLRANDGTELWRSSHADYIGSSPLVLRRHKLVVCGVEYARPTQRGGVCAFHLEDGSTAWEAPCDEFVHASPISLDQEEKIVVGSNSGDLLCLNARDGAIVWKTALQGAIKAKAATDGRYILVGTFANRIYCLSARNGDVLWTTRTMGLVYSTPLLVDGFGYIGCSDRYLYKVNIETGSLDRKHRCEGRIFSSPRLGANGVIFGTTAGWVYELDYKLQRVVRRCRVPGRVTNDVVEGINGSVLVSCDCNALYAFQRAQEVTR